MARQDDMQASAPARPKMTYDDYLALPDDGRRHELIDGEHLVTPSPDRRHQEVSLRLAVALANYLRERPSGRVYEAPLDVILSNVDVVEPDILYVSNERAGILGKWIHGAPDLVVEILSPSTRKTDEALKRRLYGRMDVTEYWIVDPELDIVKVYRRAEDGTFPRVTELSSEAVDSLTTPLLPGFTLKLRDLFE